MKIKRFNESEVQGPSGQIDAFNDISPDKIDETIDELTSCINNFSEKLTKLKKIESDLSKFKSKSKSKMDQIDDSFIQLQKINRTIEMDINDKLDTVIQNLKDRKENGKNYIYGG
jgi:DNA repair ATPase RecN